MSENGTIDAVRLMRTLRDKLSADMKGDDIECKLQARGTDAEKVKACVEKLQKVLEEGKTEIGREAKRMPALKGLVEFLEIGRGLGAHVAPLLAQFLPLLGRHVATSFTQFLHELRSVVSHRVHVAAQPVHLLIQRLALLI